MVVQVIGSLSRIARDVRRSLDVLPDSPAHNAHELRRNTTESRLFCAATAVRTNALLLIATSVVPLASCASRSSDPVASCDAGSVSVYVPGAAKYSGFVMTVPRNPDPQTCTQPAEAQHG